MYDHNLLKSTRPVSVMYTWYRNFPNISLFIVTGLLINEHVNCPLNANKVIDYFYVSYYRELIICFYHTVQAVQEVTNG